MCNTPPLSKKVGSRVCLSSQILEVYRAWLFVNLKRDHVIESHGVGVFILGQPRNESIPSVTRRRYGHDVLKLLRNFEKLDYEIRKVELDI